MAKPQDLADEAMVRHDYRALVEAELEAKHLDFVKRIRAETLPNGELLKPKQVRGWLRKKQSEQEDGPDWLVMAEEFTSGSLSDVRPGIRREAVPKKPIKLKVQVFHGNLFNMEELPPTEVDVSISGPLGQIKAAAMKLSEIFGWTDESAAGWFLCESPPFMPGVEIGYRQGASDNGEPRWKRLTFDVPADIPITSLKRWGALQEQRESAHRGKPIGLRQLDLVVFSVQRNDGRTWTDVLEEWNSNAPKKWRYTGADARRHISRDARETFLKLMGKRLKWNRGGDDGKA